MYPSPRLHWEELELDYDLVCFKLIWETAWKNEFYEFGLQPRVANKGLDKSLNSFSRVYSDE